MVRGFLLVCLALGLWVSGFSQNIKNIIIDESANGRVFSEFLHNLENQYAVDILFNEEVIQALTVSGISGKTRLMDYLDSYLVHHRVIRIDDAILVIVEKELGNDYRRKENYIVLQQPDKFPTSINGRITDGATSEPVVGAQVTISQLGVGTLTDVDGNFQLNIPEGIFSLEVKYVGYETSYYILGFSSLSKNKTIEASVFQESTQLESVVVTAERIDANVTGTLTGVESFNIETIKSLPTFMGEVDPIKSLTTLPGVSTAGEISSGFNVRGGETGQNLIRQDGAIIYNPSHLFGFFSAFNPDLVSHVTLYKGGGPANFGGRVSSVLDVDLKNGDVGKHSLSGGIGLVSSRLTLEGPIKGNKSSYIVGGRISYSDWLIHSTNNIQLESSSANFYDITGKIFHTVNNNNAISLSVYNSHDNFRLATDSTFSWGTLNFSSKWDHTFNDKLSSTLNLNSSNYFSGVSSNDEIEGFRYSNSIQNLGAGYDLYLKGEKAKISAGFELGYTILEPGKLNPNRNDNNQKPENIHNQNALESALYIQGDADVSEQWNIAAGLRYSNFSRLGRDIIYQYDYDNLDGRYPSIVDSVYFKNGEVIKNFGGLEPRLSIRYLINDNSSIKAGYYRTYQYLHLISNTTSTTPQDYWISSGPHLMPEIGNQVSLGYFRNSSNNQYEFSIEGFYKEIENAVDYIEGADITLNPALEAGLTQGDGLSYGVELLLRKNSGGKITGWISYTYSRSLRRFNSGREYKLINEGEYYPSSYDKPHNASLIINYRLGKLATLSANFNYSTGRPITIPVSKFSYDAYLAVLNYSDRNEYRIPDYHRLDLSLTLKDKPRKNKRISGEWIISIYNIYGRKNAYSIFFNRYGTATKLSILGSMFPSFTYNFKF